MEFARVAGRPESISRAGVESPGKEVQVAPEMVRKDQEPHLVGRPDIQYPFERECARGQHYFPRGFENNIIPGGMTILVKGQHEFYILERVVIQRQIGEGGITAEICITALVHAQGMSYVDPQVFQEEIGRYIG